MQVYFSLAQLLLTLKTFENIFCLAEMEKISHLKRKRKMMTREKERERNPDPYLDVLFQAQKEHTLVSHLAELAYKDTYKES